jgi:hypothetical protein
MYPGGLIAFKLRYGFLPPVEMTFGLMYGVRKLRPCHLDEHSEERSIQAGE